MRSGNLIVDKIVTATREVVKVMVQRQVFPKEFMVLSGIFHWTPSLNSVTQGNSFFVGYINPLWKLNPVMVDDVISVRGHLERASTRQSAKHPTILPS